MDLFITLVSSLDKTLEACHKLEADEQGKKRIPLKRNCHLE